MYIGVMKWKLRAGTGGEARNIVDEHILPKIKESPNFVRWQAIGYGSDEVITINTVKHQDDAARDALVQSVKQALGDRVVAADVLAIGEVTKEIV